MPRGVYQTEESIIIKFRPSASVLAFLLVFVFSQLENALAATTHYIAANGADSNNGTSETTPWSHAPGMANCASACASYTPVAGDQFILRGGDTWTNSSFPWKWNWAGTSGSPIYVGVDKTWFSGGSFARPIFSLGGTAIGSNGNLILLSNNQYITFDNFEITGFKDNGNNVFSNNVVFTTGADAQNITNMYMHAWVANLSGNDDMVFIQGCNTNCNQPNALFEFNYMNGSDATPASTSDTHGSGQFIKYPTGGTIAFNYVNNVSNVFVGTSVSGGAVKIHDNNFGFVWTSFDATNHENIMEFQIGGNTIYNNVYHDTTSTSVWPMPLDPTASSTDWVFNNVCYNVTKDCISIDTSGTFPSYTANIYNNTLVPASGYFCADTTDRGATNSIGALKLVNNYCVTGAGTSVASWCFSGTSSCSTVTTLTQTTNVITTASMATTQGYTASETFPYSPTAVTNATVGTGTNETGVWPTGSTNDTAYGCTIAAGNMVTCPSRTQHPRPSTAAWDVGAYESGGGPSAPTSLTGIVQ